MATTCTAREEADVIIVVWLLRVFGISSLLEEIRSNRASSALYLTVFSVILVLELGSVTIIYVESADPQANIKADTDGIWWGFVTITTVGYGNLYGSTRVNFGRRSWRHTGSQNGISAANRSIYQRKTTSQKKCQVARKAPSDRC